MWMSAKKTLPALNVSVSSEIVMVAYHLHEETSWPIVCVDGTQDL